MTKHSRRRRFLAVLSKTELETVYRMIKPDSKPWLMNRSDQVNNLIRVINGWDNPDVVKFFQSKLDHAIKG
jgi:uncharacterized protein YcaQ